MDDGKPCLAFELALALRICQSGLRLVQKILYKYLAS